MVFIIGIIDLKYFNWKKKEEKKEEKKEGKKKRKKERKEEFFEGGEFIPLKYCFFNCVCFPVAYFQTSSKSNFAFHSGANKLKAKPKNKKQKKFFSNRVVHMWTKKINYLNWLKMKTINFIFYDPFSWLILK